MLDGQFGLHIPHTVPSHSPLSSVVPAGAREPGTGHRYPSGAGDDGEESDDDSSYVPSRQDSLTSSSATRSASLSPSAITSGTITPRPRDRRGTIRPASAAPPPASPVGHVAAARYITPQRDVGEQALVSDIQLAVRGWHTNRSKRPNPDGVRGRAR